MNKVSIKKRVKLKINKKFKKFKINILKVKVTQNGNKGVYNG